MDFLLETERLALREVAAEDLGDLHEVLGDPFSMRYYPSPFDLVQVAEWIERQQRFYRERGHGLWAVVLKSTGEMIGDTGLTPQTPVSEEEIEVGWHIHPDHQRKGYATEAARACVEWAWANLDVPRLISMIRPENAPSQGVARKLGMEPTIEFNYKGTLHDLWVLDRREGRDPSHQLLFKALRNRRET